MSFAQPVFLAGLALVPLAIAYYLHHQRERRAAALAFASPVLMASIAPSTPGWRRHVPLAVYTVALTVLLLALAKPQRSVAVPIERASIMLTTDYSGSMQSTDVKPTRLAASRAAAERFLTEVPDTVRIGLVSFNQSARLVASPTTDREQIRTAIAALQPSGGTATGDALSVALTALTAETDDAGARVPSAIVLLSDGKSVRGRRPTDVAQRARQLKIPIYTVALGTPTGTITVRKPDGTSEVRPVPPDPFEMEQVADISRGRAFTADNLEKLSTVYEQLGSRIGYRTQQRELTAAFSGGAIVFLAAGALLSLHWFRRLV